MKYAEVMSKIVDGLRGEAFIAAKDTGVDRLWQPGGEADKKIGKKKANTQNLWKKQLTKNQLWKKPQKKKENQKGKPNQKAKATAALLHHQQRRQRNQAYKSLLKQSGDKCFQ